MSFKSNLLSTGGAQVIIFFAGMILSVLNARLIGPEGVGVFALLTLMKNLGMRISDFGFGRAFRYYSANKEIDYFTLRKVVYRLGLTIGVGVVSVGILLKFLPIGVWDDINLKVYILFIPTMFFFVLVTYLRHLLHGQLLISAINISDILERVFYIILLLLFVWILDWGLIGVSLALSLSTFLLLIQLYRHSILYKPSIESREHVVLPINKKLIKKLWKYGQWSYYATFTTYLLEQFPIIYLKSTVGVFSQIGYFTKAQGLSNYPKIMAVPVSGLLFSYNASNQSNAANNRTEVICRLSFWIVTIVFFGMGLFIKPIILLLYGEEFLPAAKVYFYLYPSIVFYIQVLYLTTDIAARGMNRESFTIRLRSLPIIIIASLLLITQYKLIGAAIAISLSFSILWVQYVIKYLSITKSSLSSLLLINKGDIKMILGLLKKIRK